MVDAREYHEETNHTPESIRSGSHTLDERTKPRPFKAYRDLETIDLPGIVPPQQPALSVIAESAAVPTPASASPPPEVDGQIIATLCYLAAGITQTTEYKGQTTQFRAASCTGNLHHIDLYPVIGDTGDLPAGVYHFDPTSFTLDVLRQGSYRGSIADAAGSPAVEDAPVTVVVTSTWWRNAWKYRARTYRHAFWDGGTVIANLLAGAHGLDLRAEVITGFVDDDVADLVGVNPTSEAPIAAVAIGSGDSAGEPDPVAEIDPETQPLSPERIEYPLIPEAWRQSRLSDREETLTWLERCQSLGTSSIAQPGTGDRIDLEPVSEDVATKRPLLQTIRRRGSKRQFDDSGPSKRQLGTVLDRAARGVPADYNGGDGSGHGLLTWVVLTTDVEDVPDGAYQFIPASGTLERIGAIDAATKQHLALDQAWAGEAHVNAYLMADIESIVDQIGNRGYRLAQLEAGICLGRLYLSAAAHRTLGGTGLTFYDPLVRDQLQPRAGDRLPMTMFAFGRIDPDAGPRL